MLSNITVPAGYYSLPELATALSTPGRKIVCDNSLSNRIALIRLNDQPLSVIEARLSTTFGIKFVAEGTGQTIVPDPARQKQEKLLRDTFIGAYASSIAKVWNRANELIPQLNPQSLAAAKSTLEKMEKQGGEDAPAVKLLLQIKNGWVSPLSYQWLTRGLDMSTLLQHDLVEHGNEDDLQSVIDIATGKRLSVMSDLHLENLDPSVSGVRVESLAKEIGGELTYFNRITFDPVSGQIAADEKYNFRPNSGNGGLRWSTLVPDQVQVAHPNIFGTFSQAGLKGYLNRQRQTVEFLESPAARKTLSLPTETRSVAEVILAWTEKEGKDLVMEVSPVRDRAPYPTNLPVSLAKEMAVLPFEPDLDNTVETSLMPPFDAAARRRTNEEQHESSRGPF